MAFNKATSNYFDDFVDEISFVCTKLARKNVAELERVSTAVYVSTEFPHLGAAERQAELRELKPHITAELAVVAFAEAEPFVERALA